MGRMKKREAIAIIEATLRQQAATGTVSSKLVEQLVTVRGWSRKKTAKRAPQPATLPVAEVPLPELIAQAKELEVSQPAPRPVQTPQATQPPVKEPTEVQKWTLDAIRGLTSELSHPPQPASTPPPPPAAEPIPCSRYGIDCLPNEECDEPSGDMLFW